MPHISKVFDVLEKRMRFSDIQEPSLWEMAIYYYAHQGMDRVRATEHADKVCAAVAKEISHA